MARETTSVEVGEMHLEEDMGVKKKEGTFFSFYVAKGDCNSPDWGVEPCHHSI
jgi:hypothetical protein